MILRVDLLLLAFLVAGVPAVVSAQKTEGEKAAEAALEKNGVKRLGSRLIIAEETEFGMKLREVAALKRTGADAEKKLVLLKKQADGNTKLISTYLAQRLQISARIDRGGLTVQQNNQLVNLYNSLGDKIQLLREAGGLDDQLKAARGESFAARDAYIQHVLEMRKLADVIAQKYAELPVDAEVKAAIDQLNKETDGGFELAVSRTFQSSVLALKRLEDSVLSESIEVRKDASDTFLVATLLNGKHTKELTIDSGSSLVCLPQKMAVEIGAAPTEQDQTIVLVLADGSRVDAKLVTLKSVRVGKFTIEDVECAVMPPELTEAAPILGMSFLRNFSFKLDSNIGKLTMTKVDS